MDYESSLPIMSLDDADEKVQVKIMDFTDPDGVDKQLEISEKKAHVRNHGKDSDGTDQEVLLSQEGHTQSNGDYDAANNKRPSSQGLISSDRAAAPDETTMNKRPTSIAGDDDKVALDVAISDSQGNRIDENNPLAIYLAESPGEEIDEYDNTEVAKDGNVDVDYTVTALKTLKSIAVQCSAAVSGRFELLIETGIATGIFTAVATTFVSSSDQKAVMTYKKSVGPGIKVRVNKLNRDNNASDMYSQLQGLEI